MDDFLLAKWYLDCVADNGDAFIGYAARLRMKRMVLHYSSILLHDKRTGLFSDTSIREGLFPQINESRISWSSDSLSVNGQWDALSTPVERVWDTEGAGTMRWLCHQPLGRATVQIGTRRRLEGLGYVEQLTQTIPPWKLPFNELRWGHLLIESETIVWIGWTGTTQKSVVVRNGVEVPGCAIGDDDIHGDGDTFNLQLREKIILRNGLLVSTALSKVPGISSLFPSGVLNTHECKWLSQGLLNRPSLPSATGWAIHEVVRFR
jgi:hypothetical protein